MAREPREHGGSAAQRSGTANARCSGPIGAGLQPRCLERPRHLSVVYPELSDWSVTKVTDRKGRTPRRLSQENSSLAPLNSYLGAPASSRARRQFNGAPASLRSPPRTPHPAAAAGTGLRPCQRGGPDAAPHGRFPLPDPPGFPRSGAEGAAGPEPRRPRRGREALQGGSARSYPPPPDGQGPARPPSRATSPEPRPAPSPCGAAGGGGVRPHQAARRIVGFVVCAGGREDGQPLRAARPAGGCSSGAGAGRKPSGFLPQSPLDYMRGCRPRAAAGRRRSAGGSAGRVRGVRC